VKVERPKSSLNVDNYKAKDERYLVADPLTPSLYLMIGAKPRGSRSWVMRFRRPNGKAAKLVIGRYDGSETELKDDPEPGQLLSLLAARELAAKIHRRRAMGVDVIGDHKARRQRHRTVAADATAGTFAAAVLDYAETYVIRKKGPGMGQRPRSWRETTKFLGLAYPRDGGEPEVIPGGLAAQWGDKQVTAIDGHDIHIAITDARKFGMPGIKARKKDQSNARERLLFVALSSLFGWLRREQRILINPIKNVPTPVTAQSLDRALDDVEIKIFWRACEQLGQPFGAVFKLLLLTGSRLNEMLRMTRGELSEDGTMWNLDGSRTKNKRAHVVPLASLAQEIIAAVPEVEGTAGYVFSLNGRNPIGGWSGIKAQLDKAMAEIAGHSIKPFRTHDLRRTFCTRLGDLGIRPDVIEMAVNHVSGARAGVAGNYNKSTLMPERREALERWSLHVAGLVADNVTPIGKGRRRG